MSGEDQSANDTPCVFSEERKPNRSVCLEKPSNVSTLAEIGSPKETQRSTSSLMRKKRGRRPNHAQKGNRLEFKMYLAFEAMQVTSPK